jgi:hypothetical protein
MLMAGEKSEQQALEEEWQAAEKALAAAQSMPGGPPRIAALREAGQMRFAASEKILRFVESPFKDAEKGKLFRFTIG